jgi:hypothetical protein
MFNTITRRIQLADFAATAGHLRLGLALISLVALAFGGSACAYWD